MFWTGDCGVRAADVVLQIPEMVKVLAALGEDPTLPEAVREDFGAAVGAVMRGINFLPDDNSSLVALLADATRLARVIEAHVHHLSEDKRPVAQIAHYILHEQDDYSPRC